MRRRVSAVGRWMREVGGRVDRVWHGLADQGTTTAEYAVVMVAACAFGGLLLGIVRSDQVRGMLVRIVNGALNAG